MIENYRAMKDQGASPRAVYERAKADGLGEIALIRLIRELFSLSLREAKQVSNAAHVWDKSQELAVGGTVYWEGWDTVVGFYFMQGNVKAIDNGRVVVNNVTQFTEVNGSIVEEALPEQRILPTGYFDKPLGQRLSESLTLVNELATINR